MMKRLMLCAALCSSASSFAQESTSEAPAATTAPTAMPDAKFGIVFNLQNFFQNPGLLTGFNGGIGVQFGLSPTLALRPVISLTHSSDPAVVTETVTTAGDMVTTTKRMTQPSPTSTFGLMLGTDLLHKLTTGALSPYVGGGLWFRLNTEATVWRDDVSVMDRVSTADDSTLELGVGGRGILGVSWRVHANFQIFAEYSLNLTIVDHTSTRLNRQVTSGMMTSGVRSSSAATRVFDFSTALSQGAALGLVAFF